MKLMARVPRYYSKYLVKNRYWVYIYDGNPNMNFVYDTVSGKRQNKPELIIAAYNYQEKNNDRIEKEPATVS